MTLERRQWYIEKLKEAGCSQRKISDPEYKNPAERHQDADDLLCQILTELGFADVVEAYNNYDVRWWE